MSGKRRWWMAASAVCLAGWLAGAGCGKEERGEPGPVMPEPVSEAEAERGAEACRAYVERVCACARARPDSEELGEACHMAPAKVTSLDLVLRVNRSPKDVDERVTSAATVRRIIRSCMEEQGKLDSRGCPR